MCEERESARARFFFNSVFCSLSISPPRATSEMHEKEKSRKETHEKMKAQAQRKDTQITCEGGDKKRRALFFTSFTSARDHERAKKKREREREEERRTNDVFWRSDDASAEAKNRSERFVGRDCE